MFGYVNVLKDELKVCDYNTFRAYYCGLCKSLGKNNGIVSRLGLSYDMTFLLIVLSALSEDEPEFCAKGCMVHPLTKRKTLKQNKISEYVADVSCMLVYLKAKDDFSDERSIKALFAMLMYYPCIRGAKKRYPELYKSILDNLGALSKLEAENSSDIDAAADCFSKITEVLFSYTHTGDEKRILSWLGYNIGRWIYVIDAFSDIEKDFRNKSYNPFLARKNDDLPIDLYIKKLASEIDVSLTLTLSSVASAYELLSVRRSDAILRNILYDGLMYRQHMILNKRKDNDNESI